jgi:hypothetical protein
MVRAYDTVLGDKVGVRMLDVPEKDSWKAGARKRTCTARTLKIHKHADAACSIKSLQISPLSEDVCSWHLRVIVRSRHQTASKSTYKCIRHSHDTDEIQYRHDQPGGHEYHRDSTELCRLRHMLHHHRSYGHQEDTEGQSTSIASPVGEGVQDVCRRSTKCVPCRTL